MNQADIVCRQGVGQDAYVDITLFQVGEKADQRSAGDEIRRHDEHFPGRSLQHRDQLGRKVGLRVHLAIQGLVRIIEDDRGRSPDKLQLIQLQLLQPGRRLNGPDIVGAHRRTSHRFERLARSREPLSVDIVLARKRRHGVNHITVPVLVKHGGHRAHNRSYCEHIEIGKGRVRLRIEVLIADIAPAHHGQQIVGREGLVVHSVIQSGQV